MAVALVAICLIALLATRPAAENTLADSPLVGKQAPSLAGSTLTGGRFSLGEDRGKYVVVNFFASWCPACQVEEPQLVQFAAEQRRGTHVAVLGVLFSDSASNAVSFFRSNGATWPAITDPQGQIAITYGVTNPPESFLVAPDGMVLAKIVGGVTASGLDHLIAEAGSIGRER
jgi:cytochrome c biogenesis protein CcmG/thiol:disulfide interchange protein DsbE